MDDEKSIIAMEYQSDEYGSFALHKMNDVFGNDLTSKGYLQSIGISTNDFINCSNIDPRILLHKYIDENDELAAIKLIEKEGKDFDVNYEFNYRIPIFSTVNSKMYKLFDVIVNHPKWDSSILDGFGEPLIDALVYLYGCEEMEQSKEDEKHLKTMILSLLKSKQVDFNARDLNDDTTINIACEYPSMAWIVAALVSNRNIDVNVVSTYNTTALTNALANKNIEALTLLGMRPDLKVRSEEKSLANKMGIDLSKYIKPTESVFNDVTSMSYEELEATMVEA
jgi:hypothetical protein